MCENTVWGVQDFLAVPQYLPNKLILTVVGSCPQFRIVLEVAYIAFLKILFFKFARNFEKSQIGVLSILSHSSIYTFINLQVIRKKFGSNGDQI
jgi:hypothetical protein